MVIVALVGIAVNVVVARMLAGAGAGHSPGAGDGHDHGPRPRPTMTRADGTSTSRAPISTSLNDLYGFIGTVIAGIVILATGFVRADPIASLVVAGLMLYAAYGL